MGARLSREVIAQAALRLVDEGGVEALTARRLAAELGVGTMSVYHYVPSRDDLLDVVVGAILEEVEPPVNLPGDPWDDIVRRAFSAYRDTLLAHPRAAWLVATRTGTSPGMLALVDTVTTALQDEGLGEDELIDALQALAAYTLGHVLVETGPAVDLPDDDGALASARLGSFERGLAMLTRGLRRGR